MSLHSIRSIYGRFKLPSDYAVKQFVAAMVLALFFNIEPAHGAKTCTELFRNSPNLPTDTFEKAFQKYKNENDARFEKMKNDPNVLRVMSKPVAEDKLNTTTAFDRALMGPLAQLFDLSINVETKKVEIKKNEVNYSVIETENKKLIDRIKNIDNKKYDHVFNSVLDIENLIDGTVLVQLSSKNKKDQDLIQSAVKASFHKTYLSMVSWNYRASGLLENTTQSSLLMYDDVAVYANESKYFDFALVFDEKVWEIQKSILTEKIDQYYAAQTVESKDVILKSIGNPTEPFMPSAGMAIAKSHYSDISPEARVLMGLKPGKDPVELKRYFKNDLEDPLGLLGLGPKKEDFQIRHKMIYRTVEMLPAGTPLEIHAHSKLHVRAYTKLGFTDTGLMESEKFKNVEIHLLKASREEVLLKIQSILDRNQ